MISSIKRLFHMAGEFKGIMVFSILLAISSVAAGIVPYFFIRRFLEQILGENPEGWELLYGAVGVGVFLTLKSLLFIVSTMMSHKAAYRILHKTRMLLAEKLTRLPLGYVLERDSGVIKKVMENDVEELERFLAHNIPEAISSAIVPLFVSIYLFYLDWRMTVALLLSIPLATLFYVFLMKGTKGKMKKYYDSLDKMNAVSVEYVHGMKEIKAFDQGEMTFYSFSKAIKDYREQVLEWYKSSWPFMAGYYVLLQGSLAVVLPMGLYLVSIDNLGFSMFALFGLISMSFASPLLKLAEFADGITMVTTAEQNIYGILQEPELYSSPNKLYSVGKNLSFNNVFFSYDGVEDVLKGISFEIEEGKSLAIVGESGSGKSTVAKLLSRFWDVKSGSIKIGGVDIRSLKDIDGKISFVFQDTFLFNISIMENIGIGKPGATEKEIIQASKAACCHEFIMNTQSGYRSLAGEGGSLLSGGQRQRICIARAILKNAPILILDEATASIDPDCEEQIQKAVGALTHGKTLIVIAHRLRTIINFDNILLLKGGKVIARGTHMELLRESAEYEDMYRNYSETESWVMGKEV